MIHAGNISQISDGSAGLLMMTSEKAAQLGLTPIARIHTAVVAGDDPRHHADRADARDQEGTLEAQRPEDPSTSARSR